MSDIDVRPVTQASWTDFEALFEARGGPHYCWCSVYRFPNRSSMNKRQKKSGMQRLVRNGVPVGVLAYDGETPIGWCSIAPRQSYARLERSRKMPRVTPADLPTWTVLCFFVSRPYRRQGVSGALLQGAITYAQSAGAKVIEAYPFDTAGTSSTHRGYSLMFQRAGFQLEGARWFLNLDAK